MRAIVLAAGQGTRLRPYTDYQPKCMVSLAGRPLIYRQLDVLRSTGIKDITLVGGYRADCLDNQGVGIVINPRYDRTNMVTTLFCAREQMKRDEDLIIAYGDIVYEPRVLHALLAGNAPICIAADLSWRRFWEIRMRDVLSDVETFRMDNNGRILELGKKPRSYDDVQAQYMGLIKVRGDVIEDFIAAYDDMDRTAIYDGKDFDNMYMTSFLQHLIDIGWDVHACLVNNGWLEVDTVDDLETYEKMEQAGHLSSFYRVD